ncbi:MAG: hypothetical protein M0Z82_13140 [Actinomycetota bacterium]|nr:hypothetical protein [Actinomycetota bacterium]
MEEQAEQGAGGIRREARGRQREDDGQTRRCGGLPFGAVLDRRR